MDLRDRNINGPSNNDTDAPTAPAFPINEPIVDDSNSDVDDDSNTNDSVQQPNLPAPNNAEILRTLQALQARVNLFAC